MENIAPNKDCISVSEFYRGHSSTCKQRRLQEYDSTSLSPSTASVKSSSSASSTPTAKSSPVRKFFKHSPIRSPAARKRSVQSTLKFVKDERGKHQAFIDAGQTIHGSEPCSGCGMFYNKNDPSDHRTHSAFHHRYASVLKFSNWKKAEVVREYLDGKVIVIHSGHPPQWVKKSEEIRSLIDEDLGFSVSSSASLGVGAKCYLYVDSKRILGCCIATPIHSAFRVVQQKLESQDSGVEEQSSHCQAQHVWYCSSDPVETAMCGISRIWVQKAARRRRLASRLLDSVRSNFSYGSCLEKDQIAFSDPTPDGRKLAQAYCKTPEFLVYTAASLHTSPLATRPPDN